MATTIEIEDMITVGTLAERLKLPVSRIITELMKSGVMATVNERIDFDTAQIIVEELKLDIELTKKVEVENVPERHKRSTSDTATDRPPVVAVMGHVDHGKTSLLDAIRGAEVAKGEAGGITQHISAYQVTRGDKQLTLLDTPGHEAFAAIREHGAHLTDIVVIVVAADDGIKPQTVEAIRFANKAGAKIVVALNKMDKEGANPGMVKGQLAEHNLMVEEFGGDIVAIEVSAKTGAGIDKLLDSILLVAEVEELKAEVEGPAQGLVIEARLAQGRGPIARLLIEEGTLARGDFIVSGASYGKVRTLEGTNTKTLAKAGPSTPVVVTGFKTLPEFGDNFHVVASEKLARIEAEKTAQQRHAQSNAKMSGSELIRIINRSNQLQEFKVILKADVQGSLTSVADSLHAIDTDEVATRIVGSGVGVVTESDVHLAHTTGAIIYGFNIEIPSNIKRLASRDKVEIRTYRVIYELLDDVREELTKLLHPNIVENEMGRLLIRGIFNTTKSEVICGGEVTKGKLVAPALARVYRGDELLMDVEITQLKRGPQDTKEVFEGEMCGMSLSTPNRLELQEGDRIEAFTRETVARTL